MGNLKQKQKQTRRIFTLNELSLRLSPALAAEIGLNESIMLQQIDYWISISDHFIDGKNWTYQSVRDMQEKAFPFWSVSTVSRTVNSLLDKGLIIEGNYNSLPYDKTRWFALNFKELSKLKSIMIGANEEDRGSETPLFQFETAPLLQNETGLVQPETPLIQPATALLQHETTIPQITPQNEDDEDDKAGVRQDLGMGKPGGTPIGNSLSSPSPEMLIGFKAIAFAETNLQRSLCAYEREKLKEWCAKFAVNPDCPDPESIVIAGLELCVAKQDLSNLTAYMDTVLEDFQKNNIINIEQIYNLRKTRNNNTKNKPYSDSKKNRVTLENNYGQPKPGGKYENFYL